MNAWWATYYRGAAFRIRLLVVIVLIMLAASAVIDLSSGAPVISWWMYLVFIGLSGFFWLVSDLFKALGNRTGK